MWDDYTDMITVDRKRAAVVRLPGSVDILNPQGPAVWVWTGRPDSVIRALFGLVEPDNPDAPRWERYEIPAELTVPLGWQAMKWHTVRPHEPQARADRLRLAGLRNANSLEFFVDLFGLVDRTKILAFAERFDPDDSSFQFAGYPSANGPDAIVRQVTMFHSMFASVRHVLNHYDELPDRAAQIRGDGIFLRHDGSTVVAPFMSWTQFDSEYRIRRHEGYVNLLHVLPCLNCGHQA